MILALRRVGAGVDQADAEAGADAGELAGAVDRAVVDVEAVGAAGADQEGLEHGQEVGGGLAEGEGGMGHEARGVVNEGEEEGLAAAAAVGGVAADLGAVHEVAHEELAGIAVAEAAAVLGGVVGARAGGQAGPAQHAVDGRAGHAHVGGHPAAGPRPGDHLAHRQVRVLLLDLDQQVADRRRQPPRAPAVAARFRAQGVEAALPVVADPRPQGRDRDAGAPTAGNLVLGGGQAPQAAADALPAGRPAHDPRNHAVAEERHALGLVGFAVGHGLAGLRDRFGAVPPALGPR